MHDEISMTRIKAAYAAPQLTVFGGVAELTASGSNTMIMETQIQGGCRIDQPDRGPCRS